MNRRDVLKALIVAPLMPTALIPHTPAVWWEEKIGRSYTTLNENLDAISERFFVVKRWADVDRFFKMLGREPLLVRHPRWHQLVLVSIWANPTDDGGALVTSRYSGHLPMGFDT